MWLEKFMVAHKLNILLVIILEVSMISGCAVSVFGKNNTYKLNSDVKNARNDKLVLVKNSDYTISLSSNCDRPTLYTAMLSPVLPLPPIIPVWYFDNKETSKIILVLEGEEFQYYSIKVTLSKNGNITHAKLNYYHTEWTPMQIHFDVPQCAFLDNTIIKIEGLYYKNKLLKLAPIKMEYYEGEYFIDFGYLRE